MKQFLILLSSITTLTISSTTFVNLNQNTTFTNNLQTNNNNDSQNSLFNNQYGYLSTSDWITNQSTTDHKFYSYDTSALKNYTFINARNTFLVDTTGNLVYNSKIIVPDKDKINIENTKQEIISHKKITTVQDDYNPYSKSEYSNSHFSGDNTDWQYVQLGEVEKNIDISKQAGADKVEHNNSLSEAWGLYYIGKTARQNKISRTIANKLGQYFINQSSLKGQISNELTTTIVNLIINNKDIYNFLYNAPIKIIDKNYSLNWIFDNSNNLVEIYYNKFNKDNINQNISYNYSDSYGGTNSSDRIDGPNIILLSSWKNYAHNWESFIKIYPNLTFDNSSYIEVQSQYGTGKLMGSQLNINSSDIDKNQLWYIENKHDGGAFGAHVVLQAWVLIAHDDNNIYLRWHINEYANYATEGLHFKIYVNSYCFNNIMN